MKTHFFNLNNMYFLKYLCKMLGSLTSAPKLYDSTLIQSWGWTWTYHLALSKFEFEFVKLGFQVSIS